MNGNRVFAIILAAGRSTRMGQLKQTMAYGESTMLDAVISAALEYPLDGLALVVHEDLELDYLGCLPELCYLEVNDDPESEMIQSVQLGLNRLVAECNPSPNDGVMILLADQPQVSGGTIATCAETYLLPRNPPGILIAAYKRRRGHPTIFGFRLIQEVLDWSADRRLNELAELHADEVRELAITTQAMPIDVNTPDDYEQLKRLI